MKDKRSGTGFYLSPGSSPPARCRERGGRSLRTGFNLSPGSCLTAERREDGGSSLLKPERGLTLIEVLVALTVLGLSLLALAPMFTGAVRTNASANQLTNANTLARDKLEELSGFPRSDARLAVAAAANAAGPPGTTIAGAIVSTANLFCQNDLPRWHKPSTGETSTAAARPGPAWFLFPYTRTYTIEQFDGNLTTRITSPNPYVVKLITVTVTPTSGPFPGLRRTRQALYLRVRDLV